MEHQRGFLVFIICFLRSSQVSHSSGLTIDNQLVIIANDCYTRVAIGFKLPDMDIFSSVAVDSISECEDECSKRRNSCNAFAFGIGIKGNGTCALSRKIPKPEELQTHADYDVYVRSQRSLHCEPDRLYKIKSGDMGRERGNETKSTMIFGSGLSDPTIPSILSSSRVMGNTMHSVANDPSYQQGYVRFFDDKGRRISDILRNRNPIPPASDSFGSNVEIDNDLSIYPSRKSTFGQQIHSDSNYDRPDFGRPFFRNHFADINHLNFESNSDNDLRSYKPHTVRNELFEVFSRPIFVHDETSKSKSPADFKFWIDHVPTKDRNTFTNHRHQNQGFFNDMHKDHGTITRLNELVTGNYDINKIFRPSVANSYNVGIDEAKISTGRFEDTFDIRNPSLIFRGFGARITDKSCYRRLLSGKKSLELHVRRAIECENIEDCHRACDYEKFFICEGFNYRRMGHGTRGMCEMTSVPYSRMDFHRDFISDPQCDYYEKDPNCVANAPATRPSYWNQPSRPSQPYGPPSGSSNQRPDTRPYAPDRHPLEEVPRPLDFDRRPSNEIPRPFDYGGHRRPPTIYGHPHHDGQYDDTFDRRNYQGHTEYSGTKWEDSIGYGGRYPSRRPAYGKPPWTRYPNRRIDHGPTHDIGTNEIAPYLPDYRKDPTRDWGTYSTVYGGSYGYDTNYVGKFDVSKYHPKSPQPKSPPPPPPPHPYENDHFYGDFYNYGGAFGYGDNYIPANQDPLYGGTGKTEECSVRAGAGFKLSKGVVRKTYLTPNLDQCESLCINEKSYICMSFSYRYNVAPTDPTDNCLLSDVSYKDLNFYVDLEPDRDYDIYAMIANSRICGTRRESSPHPPDECFWRVRSGFGMPADVVRKSIIVNNLGECQAVCTLAQDFTCRSFAFKYGLEQDRSDIPINCYLSDWPSQDINPAHMPDMDGTELYEKGSFGRGCEPYAVPFFNTRQFNNKQSPQGTDEVCYSGYTKPCKLTPYAVLLATYVNSEQDCRQKCSRMRETDSIPCMSYSYKLTTHGTEENCLLSDVPIRDLRPGLDYIYDNNHVLYAWKDLDPYCVITGYSIDNDHVFGGQSPLRPLLPGAARPDFNQGAGYPSVRPDDIYPDPRPYFKPGNYHGSRPFDPDRPDPIKPHHRPGDGYGDKFGYGIRPGIFGSLYPNEFSTFRHYTVNGYPCKKGTKCEKNKIAGFWTCEPEGSDYGNWDYCCAPTHHCGFSQGYQYPWCYVGSSEDQWRPCSEKYHPYLPSPRPIRPMIGSDDRHDRPDYRYDPDYGRHWPITYLHGESPPNCTDSLASADNSEGRRSNETIPIVTSNSTTIRDDENVNAIANRTRRRRLRVRTIADNRHEIFSRKIDARIVTNEATQNRVDLTSRKRAAKIERVSKPASTIASTAAPIITVRKGAQFENSKSNDGMVRVSLITPNNSLPAAGA
ncbi:uncharacterized protein LOC126857421 isoform X1 [Cataglyphis hispanica]|uniref:uncharacterized protein LOC126857421 isoform X1 n=1 Tax=Cataglyphis hispanica TaxID=1086592 RepID=UPI00217FD482|nr:uncharacterized protein LOC126857421 isoform X1 [Cataglyphis hispanica]